MIRPTAPAWEGVAGAPARTSTTDTARPSRERGKDEHADQRRLHQRKAHRRTHAAVLGIGCRARHAGE